MSPTEQHTPNPEGLFSEVRGIKKHIERIDRKLFGNGREGMEERLIRVEEQLGHLQVISQKLDDIGRSVHKTRNMAEANAKDLQEHLRGPAHDIKFQFFRSFVLDPKGWLLIAFMIYIIRDNMRGLL